jgi:signal transduction histidine kinase
MWERGRSVNTSPDRPPLLEGFITDVTDRKERERELERQNERLDEFASVVSHDLRNPLDVATGRLELVREECDSDHLDAVERAHDRMETLIDDILTVAREGDPGTDVTSVDLAALTGDCWRTVETGAATLVTDVDRSVRADESRLRQLIENLVRNAIEHADEPVTITVGGTDGGFYVEDTGPGIPPGERETVFRVGYSGSPEGTGFGLRIVERVAEAHVWSVDVTDGSEGGARFEISGVEFGDS